MAVSKAITKVENRDTDAEALLERISARPREFFVLGVTGAPGTGKSTLVDRLIQQYRENGDKVGVIAVDPTSPLTGGALLGDRVRMTRHATDKGVYIRSMASRGWTGGLSGAVAEAIQVLGAAGMGVVIVETVGIGQADVEVMRVAHAVVVVTTPGLGDEVQVSKAGLMEIGDVYVVNKGELPGGDATVVDLLAMVRGIKDRSPPVLKVSALRGDGVGTLFKTVQALRKRASSPDGRRVRLRSSSGMILEMAKRRVLGEFERDAKAEAQRLAERVEAGKLGIGEAARLLADGEQ